MSFENKYVYMKSIKAEMSKSPEDIVILQVPVIHNFPVEPYGRREERNQYNFA